jgi:iron complex transport system ATP-binding protein
MIRCLNLQIGYERDLLSQVLNIELKENVTYVLLGKNGCGKSTLLKTLAGLLPARKGEVAYPQNFSLHKDLGVVLTDSIEVPYLRVRDLVSLGRYPFSNFWGDLNAIDEEIINETLIYLKLKDLEQQEFSKLSDGLKQRVLIARALAKKPKLLLLDEPFSYLDPPNKLLLVKILKEIVARYSLTLIFSTHDWDLVSEYYENVLFINQSKCLIESSVKAICEENLLSQIFDLEEGIRQDKNRLVIKAQ